MAQGPSDTILVAIRITLRIRESKVHNPDPPDRRRFVLSEHISCYGNTLSEYVTGIVFMVLYIVKLALVLQKLLIVRKTTATCFLTPALRRLSKLLILEMLAGP